MKMPAIQLGDRRSPDRFSPADRGALPAEILVGARVLRRDEPVAPPSSPNDARAVAAFPRLAVEEDAGAGTDPAIPVWSGRTRLSLIVGLPLALWAGIFVLARFVA